MAPSPKKSEEHVYRLHIDASPAVAAVHSKSQQKTQQKSGFKVTPPSRVHTGKKNSSDLRTSSPAASPHSLWARIWDKLEFVVVTGGVFIIIYVVLNWSALAMNVEHYWKVFRGFESPLEKLVAESPDIPEKLLEQGVAHAAAQIPPVGIEVYPPDMRVVIPSINQNVPVIGVRNENLINRKFEQLESDIQTALRNGVVHYPGTALPGDSGNVVLTGHSSYYTWDPGRFKDVFALLHGVKLKDRIVVYFSQKKYIYEVNNIKVILPKDIDVLLPSDTEKLTLITCTPIGTNLKRLVIEARLVEKN